jgi:4-carboxymuconolactone decarboxylase
MGASGFDEGLAIRRAVLGGEYVDRALASADEFSQPFQEFVTEYCWGGPWTRPALDRKTRSMITLGILTALSKPKEIETHVRGALNNGCTPDEIREVLLHATVYCGVPAGVDAVRAAQPVIASWTGGEHASNDG